jgi:hypothetical protein
VQYGWRGRQRIKMGIVRPKEVPANPASSRAYVEVILPNLMKVFREKFGNLNAAIRFQCIYLGDDCPQTFPATVVSCSRTYHREVTKVLKKTRCIAYGYKLNFVSKMRGSGTVQDQLEGVSMKW